MRHTSLAGSQSPSRNVVHFWVALGAITFLTVACATAPPPPPPPERTVGVDVPVIEPDTATELLQEHTGISIRVSPPSYSVESAYVCTYRPFPMPAVYVRRPELVRANVSAESHMPIHEVRFPSNRLDGDSVRFDVTIENRMDRVWRTEGAVLQLGIGGEVQNVDRGPYAEEFASLLPPGQRRSFTVPVMQVDQLPREGEIDLYLFDIVTAIDSAGNVTERQNFEWSFDVTHERRAVRTVTGVRNNWWIPNAMAREIRRAQERGDERCWSREGWYEF